MSTTDPAPLEPDATPDAKLVRRVIDGDERAAEEMVRRFGPRMLATALRLTGKNADAHDAVQEAFLSAFRSLDSFRGDAKLATWLHRIVVNKALSRLRKDSRRQETPIDDLLPRFNNQGKFASDRGGWAVTYDTAAADRETRDFVRQKINELPETHRTVLLLRDIEEYSTDEAADLLGVRPGAVKTRLHRARQALRTLLEPVMGGPA